MKSEAIEIYREAEEQIKLRNIENSYKKLFEAEKIYKEYREKKKMENEIANIFYSYNKNIKEGNNELLKGECKKAMIYFKNATELIRDAEKAQNFLKKAKNCLFKEKENLPLSLSFSILASLNPENYENAEAVNSFSDTALKGFGIRLLLNPKTLWKKGTFCEFFLRNK